MQHLHWTTMTMAQPVPRQNPYLILRRYWVKGKDLTMVRHIVGSGFRNYKFRISIVPEISMIFRHPGRGERQRLVGVDRRCDRRPGVEGTAGRAADRRLHEVDPPENFRPSFRTILS
jgi:hypothetical protein